MMFVLQVLMKCENLYFSNDAFYHYFVNDEGATRASNKYIKNIECMPLVFENGKLIGWGNEYYARTRLMPAMPKTNAENVRELNLSGK